MGKDEKSVSHRIDPVGYYPYIKAWGENLGSNHSYIMDAIRAATATSAPWNAIYQKVTRDGDKVSREWLTIEEVLSDDLRLRLKRAVTKKEHPENFTELVGDDKTYTVTWARWRDIQVQDQARDRARVAYALVGKLQARIDMMNSMLGESVDPDRYSVGSTEHGNATRWHVFDSSVQGEVFHWWGETGEEKSRAVAGALNLLKHGKD